MTKLSTATQEICSAIEAIETDTALFDENNFDRRARTIDAIEFDIIDRVDGLLERKRPPKGLIALKQDAERVKSQLEAIDDSLFEHLRNGIREGAYAGAAFRRLISSYVRGSLCQDELGYDALDLFTNGLLLARELPAPTKEREPEMLYYQQTPTRIIFDVIRRAHFTSADVFYDLGSGLGQVSILASLIGGATAKGIEFEPAYCDYAKACVADLALPRVAFINADARSTDFSDGTVFFMYTPFVGKMLRDVLEKLRLQTRGRRIRIFTYGLCTMEVSCHTWLKSLNGNRGEIYKLGIFSSY